jgi:hypothetical protein
MSCRDEIVITDFLHDALDHHLLLIQIHALVSIPDHNLTPNLRLSTFSQLFQNPQCLRFVLSHIQPHNECPPPGHRLSYLFDVQPQSFAAATQHYTYLGARVHDALGPWAPNLIVGLESEGQAGRVLGMGEEVGQDHRCK